MNGSGDSPTPLPAPRTTLDESILSWQATQGTGGYAVHADDTREIIAAVGTVTRQFDLSGLDLPQVGMPLPWSHSGFRNKAWIS